MKNNITFSVGNLALVQKLDGQYRYFDRLFSGIGGKAKNLVSSVKLFVHNRLGGCLATNHLTEFYPEELFALLNFKKIPGERTLYRDVSRVGKNWQFLLERHQSFVKEEGLLSSTQFIDFSSSYFEGRAEALGELGYSRDGQPGKKQLTFGISVGINNIPTALTIQKGNVQDKKHFGFMLKTSEAILEENSVLIFDCGANTKKNKKDIRDKKFHYLTLKPKKVGPYKEAIAYFHTQQKKEIVIGETFYECVKRKQEDEIHYIFFSEKLKQDQLALKERKFKKTLEKNQKILNKTKAGKPLAEYPTKEGYVIAEGSLQKTIENIPNTKINGIEGFFILESSIDTEPKLVLALYKDKDKAEKLIRNIKEGTELRPMRHWSKDAIIGYVLIIFLTNFLISLTLHNAKDAVVKNAKLLKKYLTKLTLAIIYPPTGFKISFLANITPEITSILGDYIQKYRDKTLESYW